MTFNEWIVFFLIIQLVHFAGTWKFYEAAGRRRWEAAVPIYNAVVLMRIINRPVWWVALLFVPVVNLIMFPVVWVETLRAFGKNKLSDTILAVLTLGFYLYYINYTQPLNHIPDRALQPKSKSGDTVSSILFAVIVATIVHTYLIQPFTIPTSSLEKTLLVGDFLFASKVHYGARTPKTAVAFPMVHDTIPVLNVKSYSKWPQLPSFRLPGFETVERNDIVVFNWPVDTVFQFFVKSDRRADKPIDKKSNYVKRCVGIPGDTLTIVDGVVKINGTDMPLHDRTRLQFGHTVTFDPATPVDMNYWLQKLEVTDRVHFVSESPAILYIQSLTLDAAQTLRGVPGIASVDRVIEKRDIPGTFPSGKGNYDNMGPVYIPEAGKTIELNLQNLPYYKRIITEYENHALDVRGDAIFIDNQPATTYTFAQNYYWMMGDNRHNSEDSRYWGYVPEDHIVGKPVFIWFSLDPHKSGFSKIRWERVFTTVGGDGAPVSYFKYFVIALVLYFVGSAWYKKRKNATE